MSRAVLAFGSNIGDREGNLRAGLKSISLLPGTKVLDTSYVYETVPVGYLEQPLFLNAAAVIDTELSSRALLGACLGIEAALGRVRSFKNGPRILDIDLLLYENETSSDRELMLPHPRIRERAFVLVPLFDLFPDGHGLNMNFEEDKMKCSDSGVVQYRDKRLGTIV